jgi:hypothetical protein
VAVGYYDTVGGGEAGLIEMLSDGTWTATTAPTASASQMARLIAITCPARTPGRAWRPDCTRMPRAAGTA